MHLKKNIRTITQYTGFFAIAGLAVGAERYNASGPHSHNDWSFLNVAIGTFAGTTVGLFLGCTKIVLDNLIDCCKNNKLTENDHESHCIPPK